ncbi:GyrI-like domain-containing protein [Isoptericola aurantiacus]|uniref:GyrI-like domain-containing protein n=1 Tax=Isoptericola aurantiacus TaxID=3377839 RepID=UPI00383AF321
MTDPSFPEPTVVAADAQHLAVVRERVAMADVPALFDRAFPLIFAALERRGIGPVAPPLGVLHGTPGETLDIGVAVPVAEPFEAGGDAEGVAGETLAPGPTATLLVRGDYGRLPAAYDHLYRWIAAQGLTAGEVAWEQYLTEPSPDGDPARNETLVGAQLVE